MPKRTDIQSVLVIGSGPIVIGQACEFDYSGTQACRVLKAEGLRVILVNSNPATIMTDPEFADATYVEPITAEYVEKVIEKERPDALLATLGGQTALNCAMALDKAGVLEKYGVELIGASIEAIDRGENRESFKKIVEELGGQTAKSVICHTLEDCFGAADELGYPMVVRPSFTMGGTGSGMAYDADDLRRMAGAGLAASPTTEVLLEESIIGWKEYELEVMRDTADNVVIVCSIENLDPMGVHTGDSITVAPAMTLTDREYQQLRDLSIGIIRSVGVDTGGCNIQFAVNPADGRIVVIEMNPRVSRSSALASKATGFPIAKIAAKVAIGYTLDEIPNDITRETPASFEPALDYVVVKVPRFAFEKFPAADPTLTTHMKSVGEAMAIGRNFTEALQKALRSLEDDKAVFDWSHREVELDKEDLLEQIRTPHDGRLRKVMDALRSGATAEEVFAATGIDPWFVDQLCLVNEIAQDVINAEELTPSLLRRAKRHGFSDAQLGRIRDMKEAVVRGVRHALGVRPVYKTVDTCAAEFAARTPYHYSSYDEETEVAPREKPAVIILGSGPNRIGQGIEFDYSCVHASLALHEAGYETVMVNCNPETVSTDYDTSDRLYFEPLTLEDVLEIVHAETKAGPIAGVICQLGGQTPLGLAQGLEDAGVKIVGTSPSAIHLAEERGAFGRVLGEAGLNAPRHGMATSFPEAQTIAATIGFPVLVRPSYVLGGRGMEIVYDDESLHGYIQRATEISPEHPVLVDRFIDDAVEIDVDALYDGEDLYLGGVMEHIEEAGIHSGDSSCALPPITLGKEEIGRIREATEAIARGVGVRGLLNIQFALGSDVLYVLEANPRASRTVPFVSKATATPLAKAAARVMLGESIAALRAEGLLAADGDGGDLPGDAPIAVKEAVMPFNRFKTIDGKTVDAVLGPEMRSTGEVMGFDADFGKAFAKSQTAAYGPLPLTGQGVRLDGQPRQANDGLPGEAAGRPRLRDPGDPGHGGGAPPQRRLGDRRTQAQRGCGRGRREDDRRQDPRRRDQAGGEHPARHLQRRRVTPARRLRDPYGGHPQQHPVHHDRAGSRRCRAGDRGDARGRDRGALAAGLGPAGRAGRLSAALPAALRPGADPHRPRGAHGAAFRAIRAAQPVTRMLNGRRTQGREGPHEAGDGSGLPRPGGSRGGLRQERRRHRRPGQHGVRVRGDRHRHGGAATRQPQAPARPVAGRPRDRQPDGLQQRRRRARLPQAGRAAPRPHRPSPRRTPRHQHRQDQGGPRGRRRARLREEHHPARAVRRLPGRQRLLAEHTGAARPAGRAAAGAVAQGSPQPRRRRSPPRTCRCWSRSLPTSPTRTCSRWPTWPSRSGWTGSSPPTPRSPAKDSPLRLCRSRPPVPAGSPAPPLRERATEVMRLLRGRVGPEMTLIGAGGITTVEDALERLDAGADLLQAYTAFVYEGPWWPVRVNAGVREHLQDRADQPSDRREGR